MQEKEKILKFARELWKSWEITYQEMNDTYFYLFVSKTHLKHK